MRVLVLYAHPVETSFVSALHDEVVGALRARGHVVDDCDLNVEGFDPVMRRQDRIDYHDVKLNRARVAPYVERLLAAEALVLVFPGVELWLSGDPERLHRQGLPAGRQLRIEGEWRLHRPSSTT